MTAWIIAHQVPLPMGFSRQEHWSGLPFPPPSFMKAFLNWEGRVGSYVSKHPNNKGEMLKEQNHRDQRLEASKANFNQSHRIAIVSFIFSLHCCPERQGLLSSPLDIARKLRLRDTVWLLWGEPTDKGSQAHPTPHTPAENWSPSVSSTHLDSVHGPASTPLQTLHGLAVIYFCPQSLRWSQAGPISLDDPHFCPFTGSSCSRPSFIKTEERRGKVIVLHHLQEYLSLKWKICHLHGEGRRERGSIVRCW